MKSEESKDETKKIQVTNHMKETIKRVFSLDIDRTTQVHISLVIIGLKAGFLHDVDRYFMFLYGHHYSPFTINSLIDDETKKVGGEENYYKEHCQGDLKYVYLKFPQVRKYIGFTQELRYDCIYNKSIIPDDYFDGEMTSEKFAKLFSYSKPFDFKEKPTHIHRLETNFGDILNEIYVQFAYEDLTEQLEPQYKEWEKELKNIIPSFPGFKFTLEVKE
jgi:hypothetical protein